MKPDFVLGVSGGHLIGDCKYKRLEDGEFKNHDLYQLLAYCTASGVTRGVLVYPQHLVLFETDLAVQRSKVRIRQLTISLKGTIAELREASVELANRLMPDSGALALAG